MHYKLDKNPFTVVCFGPILDKLLRFKQKKNSHPPVYPSLKNCNYKKNHMNKKTHIFIAYPYLKICNYKKEPYE